MTGNVYVDALAYAGFGVWGVLLLGFPMWILLDRLRPASGAHAAIGGEEVRAELPAPTFAPTPVEGKRRSPFAPKKTEVTK